MYSSIEKKNNNLYYNATIENREKNKLIPAFYFEQRTSSIVDIPSEYVLSVERFDIPGENIPLFIFKDNTYSVTLEDPTSGDVVRVYLVYTPWGSFESDNSIYYYQHMLDIINTAFDTAHGAVTKQAGAPADAPYFTYDSNTGLFSLVCHEKYLLTNPDRLNIYVNDDLNKFFACIPAYFNGYETTDGKDAQYVIQDNRNNFNSDTNEYSFPQEYLAQEQWFDITKIVLTTSLLPVVKEYIGINDIASDRSAAILTDFIPYISSGTARVGRYILEPKVHSWIDINNTNAIDKIDINFYWLDRKNNFYPVQIAPGRHISVKLLFRNKYKLT